MCGKLIAGLFKAFLLAQAGGRLFVVKGLEEHKCPEFGRLTMRGVLAGESFGEAGEWGGVDEYLLSNIWHFMCSVNGRGDKLGNS